MDEMDHQLQRTDDAASRLPAPQRQRWEPLRSGIVNLYRFDQQEFQYEQGRLLLRGHNGTGKSRLLAMQLPFLLDGDVSPHRVEPDRDPSKKMEWNLLLGKHKDRRGYSWIEFGRLDPAGAKHYVTLGCGLQAVEGRGLTARWYFVTQKRVGPEIQFMTPQRQTLTREQLAAAIGTGGHLFTTAQDYRRQVDRTLFSLGEQRYGLLLDLLITLRQPQLSRTLNEQALSNALSDAMPPLSQGVIDVIAESMRGLEADRSQLHSLESAVAAIKSFMGTYRRYAGMASRRRGDAVRTAQSQYDGTGRSLKQAGVNLENARSRFEESTANLERIGVEETGARSAHDTLLSSPQMASARELESAQQSVREKENIAERAAADVDGASLALEGARREVETAQQQSAQSHTDSQTCQSAAMERALAVGLDRDHGAALASAPERRWLPAEIGGARTRVEAATVRRRDGARALRQLVAAAKEASIKHEQAVQGRDRRASESEAAQQRSAQARRDVDASVEKAIDDYRRWLVGLVELQPMEMEEAAVRDWAQTAVGSSPLSNLAHRALEEAITGLASAEATAKGDDDEARRHLAACEAERAGLLTGRHEPPLPPYTRDADTREGRRGAPLWSLCDFADEVPDQDRAGLEAALEASGLLDAWVTPEGELIDPASHDTFIRASDLAPLPAADHLGAMLRPSLPGRGDEKSAVSVDAVATVLSCIGVVASPVPVWVRVDGSWRNGVLTGRWTKLVAEHIGSSAREAQRQRRLGEIEQRIREINDRLAELGSALDELRQRRHAAKVERDLAPDDDAIRSATAASVEARKNADSARSQLDAADVAAQMARQVAASAHLRCTTTAVDLGLVDWMDRLDDHDEAIMQYRVACAALWPALERAGESLRHIDRESKRRDEAQETLNRRRECQREADEDARIARAHRDTLDQSVGKDAKEVVAKLETMKVRLHVLSKEREASHAAQVNAASDVKSNEVHIANLEEKRGHDESVRDQAVDSYRRFVATGMLGVAAPARRELSIAGWPTTRVIELAREIEQEFDRINVDDNTWERQQKLVFEEFKTLEDSLRAQNFAPGMHPEADVYLVQTTFQGQHYGMDRLEEVLQSDIAERGRLLDARERTIIENHLIGEVAQHLHERIRAGEQMVHDMNDELKRVPTNSGIVLKFRWDPREDGPSGLADVRRRLLHAVGMWSPQDRENVGRFLQERIKTERIANDTGTWQEQLTAALDYRRWHQFVIERKIDDQWKRLTRRVHGTGSGGEKAVTMMIPMFAAAAAHYRSASPHAPRLILLDEAFAGVDAEMRGRCMGLLGTFDLDFVMTSEHEWGCYATLPGVSICQLSAKPGWDAVYVSHWVWNGRERKQIGDSG